MIENYDFREIVYESEFVKIFRGYRTRTIQTLSPPTIIGKTIQEKNPDKLLIKKLKNEYDILRFLDHPNIVNVYQLEIYNSLPILLMEDIPFETLSEFLGISSLSLQQFFDIAVQLCSILEYLHSQNIIHKDINPQNILYDRVNCKVKLTDFNISQKVSASITGNKFVNRLEGNPYYLSPEQTGRLNRTPDFRTDLYSLGITFYEMLTRKKPFIGKNAVEIIHAHIAKKAESPTKYNQHIPQILSDIIFKLIEKNPENRYSSARGVRIDLETCLEQYKKQGMFFNFSLGTKDVFDKIILPDKIFGRDYELGQLHEAYSRLLANPSTSQFVQVIGKSGIGKTSLIGAFIKSFSEEQFFFLSGKFEQFSQTPLSGIIEIIKKLVDIISSLPTTKRDTLVKRIQNSIKGNGKIISTLAPDIETLIGAQPQLEELSEKESQNRFFYTIKIFLNSIAESESPLILFFDDLQWIDPASLNLLDYIRKESSNALIIISYRTKEIQNNQPALDFLSGLETQTEENAKILLYAFSQYQLAIFLGEIFRCSIEKVDSMANLLLEQTDGSPFSVLEKLNQLNMRGLFKFDSYSSQWTWNYNQILSELKIEEHQQFIIQRLKDDHLKIMQYASCLGNNFSIENLLKITNEREETIMEVLWESIENGLLVLDNDQFLFSHDQIQKGIYDTIVDELKSEINKNIGFALIKEDYREDDIFKITNHLNNSVSKIKDEFELLIIIECNLKAAQKARNSVAFKAAFDYAKFALALIPENFWKEHPEICSETYNQLVILSYLLGDFQQMEFYANILTKRVTDVLEIIPVYETKIQAFSIQNNYLGGLKTGLEILELLGYSIPQNPDSQFTEELIKKTITQINSYRNDSLLNIHTNTDKIVLARMRILTRLIPISYFISPLLFVVIAATGIKISFELGYSPYSSVFFVNFGLALCDPSIKEYEKGNTIGLLGLQISEKFQWRSLHPILYNNFYAFIFLWHNNIREALSPLMNVYKTGAEVGDFEFASYAITNYLRLLFSSGEKLKEVHDSFQYYLKEMEHFQHSISLNYTYCMYELVVFLGGKELSFNDQTAIKEKTKNVINSKNALGLSIYYFSQLLIHYFNEDFTSALEDVLEGEKYIYSIGGHNPLSDFIFYAALTLYRTEKDSSLLPKYINYFSIWSEYAPENYMSKYEILRAEELRVKGKKWEALQMYNSAIKRARVNEFLPDEAIANKLTFEFFLAESNLSIASLYFNETTRLLDEWEADKISQDLKKKFPNLVNQSVAISNVYQKNISYSLSTDKENLLQMIDMNIILKASQAISEEIHLESLVNKMMDLIIENSGADRAILILKKEGEFFIEAETISEPKQTVLHYSTNLSSFQGIPQKTIYTVIKNQEFQLLSISSNFTLFQEDPYFTKFQIKSALVLPLKKQKNTIGLLYLENKAFDDIFSNRDVVILKLLSSQIVISLENAKYLQDKEKFHKSEQTRIQAETANKTKTDFLARISHEIRTPINGVMGMARLISETKLTNEQQDLLDTLKLSGESLLRIIDDILDLSKIEAGKLNLEEESIDFWEFIKDTIRIAKPLIGNKNLKLEEFIQTEVPRFINTDKIRLRQILLNFLSNAIKFTEEGTIKLNIEVEKRTDNNYTLLFTIEDTGIGISEEVLQAIFEPFVQEDNSSTRKYGGTGLGLVISKKLVEMLGGKVKVESFKGEGSIFYFSINTTGTTQSSDKKIHHTSLTPLPHLKILVAEDNVVNQKVIGKILLKKEIIPDYAKDGLECLHKIQEKKYDIVLMDIEMPIMDGIQVTSEIIRLGLNKNMIIIAMTANAMVGQREQYLQMGMNDYIPKPIPIDEFYERLNYWGSVLYPKKFIS